MGFFQEGWWCSVPPVMLISFIWRSESSCRKSWPWQHTPGILVFWRLTKKNLGVYDQAGPLQRSCLKCKKEKRREGGRRRRKKWRKEERKTYNILTLINIEDPFGETQMCSAIKQQIEKCFQPSTNAGTFLASVYLNMAVAFSLSQNTFIQIFGTKQCLGSTRMWMKAKSQGQLTPRRETRETCSSRS